MTDKNTVVEDFLDEDAEISGQRYVLLSFISPEKVLEKKDLYFFNKFLQLYEVDWKLKNLEKYMVDVVKNINDQLDNGFVQKNRADVTKTKIVEAYDDFMYANKTKLEEEFYAQNEFRTSVRGIKVRGVYGNPKEAELKAKKLQSKDKYNNIFVGDVGKWLPWDPQPHDVAEQEYGQDQLNNLMRKYKENEDNRDKFFEERKKGGTDKKVFGSATDTFGSMFSSQGDLALQRKVENVIENVTESKNEVHNTE